MSTLLLGLQARVLLACLSPRPWRRDARDAREDGQATAEYALVLLGAAAIALLVVSWATKTNVVGRLLDVVFGHLTNKTKQ